MRPSELTGRHKVGRTRAAPSTRAAGRAAERRAWWFYLLRGYKVLDRNAWLFGYELDLVVRRGRRLAFVEVKAKSDARYGDPIEMVGPEKQRRLRRAADSWLAAHPELAGLETSFEIVAIRDRRLERLKEAF